MRLIIKGEAIQRDPDRRVTLLVPLRGPPEVTAAMEGCDHGQCGACAVLIEGKRMNARLRRAVTLEGCEVTTIEGVGTPDATHPLHSAFIAHDAFQCGYRSRDGSVRPSA